MKINVDSREISYDIEDICDIIITVFDPAHGSSFYWVDDIIVSEMEYPDI